GLEYGRYGVSKVLDTAYRGFLGVETTHRYAVSSLMDTAYWLSEHLKQILESSSAIHHPRRRLVLNQALSTSAKPPIKNDWDLLFQPMFYEYLKNPSAASNPIFATTLPPPDTVGASSSTSIDKYAPSASTSPNNEATNSPLNSTNVDINDEVAEFNSDTFTNPSAPPDTSSAESSLRIVDTSKMHTFQQPSSYTKR
ncbi:hypothetical protein Tco_0740806, partial [Tanacetum coccineum]